MVLFPCRLFAAWRAVAPVRYGSRAPGRTRDLCNKKALEIEGPYFDSELKWHVCVLPKSTSPDSRDPVPPAQWPPAPPRRDLHEVRQCD